MRSVGRRESEAILGAMRQVAVAGGADPSAADTASLLAAAHYPLRRPDLAEVDATAARPPTVCAALSAATTS